MTESSSFQAIQLTRSLFELINGEVGLLKFSIDELSEIERKKPTDPEKWTVICSFLESLGSTTRAKYKVIVDVTNRTLEVKKLSPSSESLDKVEGNWKFVKKSEAQDTENNDSGSQET